MLLYNNYRKVKKLFNMDEIELYLTLKERLAIVAKYKNITKKELNKYFKLTDYQNENICSFKKDSIEQVYAQFALHAQNATMINNIVKFDYNFKFLKSIFCDFRPKVFLDEYFVGNEREKVVLELINKLRFSKNNPNGLKWKTSKSIEPDKLIRRFVEAMIDGALFFKDKTKKELLSVFREKYDISYKELIKYFMKNIKHGFSIALTCDFFKEFDTYFNIPKPDVHIKDVISKFKVKTYKNKNWEYKCIDDFIDIVSVLNNQGIKIDSYKLDKMIWLCCTSNFYLDDSKNKSSKKVLLEKIN